MTSRCSDGFSTGRLTVDLGAIRANYRTVARRSAPAATAAVVKADAYGLGAARVAPALAREGCRDFFVAHLGEARVLANALPADAALYVLNGLAPGEEADAVTLGVIPVLNAPDQVRAWADAGRSVGRALPAALQVDSGMARLGLSADEALALADDAGLLGAIDLKLVMTHLARGDEPDEGLNDLQLQRFLALCERLPPAPRSIANSGGAFLAAGFRQDLVRPGVSLYGGAPHIGGAALASVATLDAPVIQTREIPAGTGIGYGHLATSDAPMRLATIGLGYADGWPRELTGRGSAWFEGAVLPFVGRVSMDSIILDIGALPAGALKAGDRVEVLGPNRPLDTVAEEAGTIAHEILARLGPRLRRVYVGEAA